MRWLNWGMTVFWVLWSAYLGGQLYYSITQHTIWAIVLYSFLIVLSVFGAVLNASTHYHRGSADAYTDMRKRMQEEIDKKENEKKDNNE